MDGVPEVRGRSGLNGPLEIEMEADWTILPVLIVIFLATLIRSAFGFGEALVAVPLLALLIPVEEAVPLATLLSITVAAIVVAQDWHKIHLLSASWLVLSTFVGIPLGLWLLTPLRNRSSRRSWLSSSSGFRPTAWSVATRSS